MKRPVLASVIAIFIIILGLVGWGSTLSESTHIEKTLILPADPERVWPLFADLTGWPIWYRAEDGLRMTSSVLSQGLAPGLNVVRHAEFNSGDWVQEKITTFDNLHKLELTGTKTSKRKDWKQSIVLESVGTDQTKVTWTLDYVVSGPIMKLLNKQRGEYDLATCMDEGLKNIIPLIPTREEWGPSTQKSEAKSVNANDTSSPSGTKSESTTTPAPVSK